MTRESKSGLFVYVFGHWLGSWTVLGRKWFVGYDVFLVVNKSHSPTILTSYDFWSWKPGVLSGNVSRIGLFFLLRSGNIVNLDSLVHSKSGFLSGQKQLLRKSIDYKMGILGFSNHTNIERFFIFIFN